MGLAVAVALFTLAAACGGDDVDLRSEPAATAPGGTGGTRGTPPDSSPSTAPGGSAALEEGPVVVESAEVVAGASPSLRVAGQLPTACHQPSYEVVPAGGELVVRVFSLFDAAAVCAQAVEPFTLAVPLGARPASPVTVTLNGEAVGELS